MQKRESALILKGTPATEGPRTYVVFGVMRGGTTMVAGVMRALGIFMGGEVNEDNQESAHFADRPVEDMAAAIARNNAAHAVWGWKYPHAADYLDRLWPSLRNPHLVCVFRDSVANGQALNRWHPLGRIQAVQEGLLRQQRNINLIALRNCPAILVSYEKAERDKALFLDEFSAALGIAPDRAAFDFDGFMAAGSYKRLDAYCRTSGAA
ncbi:MAG: hypothetical protein MUE98_05780 [Rhodobacteraceae bacterium]|jgi:hypothetical protein|nr:hypothetical protein [Paracoccaceae bacterium]